MQDFNHAAEVARCALAAHARMMRGDLCALYVYYKPYQLAAIAEGDATEGWTLALNERMPGHLSADQLVGWLKERAGRVPYLLDEVPVVVQHIDRTDRAGNLRQHRVVDRAGALYTACGFKVGESQKPAGNSLCGRCYRTPAQRLAAELANTWRTA